MIKKFLKQKIKSINGAVHIATLEEEFIAMQIFRDKLFVATKQNVYFLNKHNKLEPVKFEEQINENIL